MLSGVPKGHAVPGLEVGRDLWGSVSFMSDAFVSFVSFVVVSGSGCRI